MRCERQTNRICKHSAESGEVVWKNPDFADQATNQGTISLSWHTGSGGEIYSGSIYYESANSGTLSLSEKGKANCKGKFTRQGKTIE